MFCFAFYKLFRTFRTSWFNDYQFKDKYKSLASLRLKICKSLLKWSQWFFLLSLFIVTWKGISSKNLCIWKLVSFSYTCMSSAFFFCLVMYLKCSLSVWANSHSCRRKRSFFGEEEEQAKRFRVRVLKRVWSTAKPYTAVYWCAGLCYLSLYLKLHSVLFVSCMC